MTQAIVEHVNITVSDPQKTAEMLCKLFDWKIRWHGTAMNGEGITYHIGSESSYVAVYSGHNKNQASEVNYDTVGGLNHIGVLVDDLDATEQRVIEEGFTPKSHADYEPGRRFYFFDHDNIEFEVVSYP
ncbi:MAG: VOC family protein [Pseudomonadota bacterium]